MDRSVRRRGLTEAGTNRGNPPPDSCMGWRFTCTANCAVRGLEALLPAQKEASLLFALPAFSGERRPFLRTERRCLCTLKFKHDTPSILNLSISFDPRLI